MLKIYMHPRCGDSWHVYQLLERNSLLNLVKLTNTEEHPFPALSKGVFSVPAFELKDRVVLQGYFTEEDVILLAKDGRMRIKSTSEALDRLMKSIFSSFLVAAAVYLSGTFKVLLDARDYLLSASGAFFLPEQETFLQAAREKLTQASIDDSSRRSFHRIIAGNYVRDLYWLTGTPPRRDTIEKLGLNFFCDWLLLRASIGRVFVPQSSPQAGLDVRVREAWEYTLEKADAIAGKVLEEQAKMPRDWLRAQTT